jgi:hypothetical protein
MPKKPKPPADALPKEVVRVTFRLHGPELTQVRDVQEMLSLNSELDAARYLMQRGLEVMSGALGNRRLAKKVGENMTAETLVAALKQAGVPLE